MAISDYYDSTGAPQPGASGSSATIRAEFDAIESGFAKLPDLSGNGDLPIFVNSAGNGLTHVAVATARTNLGVGTGDSPQFTAINLGHASDTTIARSSAGVITVEGLVVPTYTSATNLKVGGSASRATTEGTNQVVLFDGTAPVGTLANGVSIYSTSGECYIMDAAGNATLQSPHDRETNEWIFYSKNTRTGKVLRIDMERMMRKLNDVLGGGFITEFMSEDTTE